jgi:molecular chaperone GrpE
MTNDETTKAADNQEPTAAPETVGATAVNAQDDELAAVQKERDEYVNLAKRLKADFDNYKKDELKKCKSIMEYSNYSFVASILPVMDDLEIAKKNLPPEHVSDKWFDGVVAIIEKLKRALEHEGLREVAVMYQKFDPNFHEALGFKDMDSGEDGVVVEEVKKGYMFGEKLARPAQVMVSRVKNK